MGLNATTSVARRDLVRPALPVGRVAAGLLIAQLPFAALFILGGAIDWPASLDEPAAV